MPPAPGARRPLRMALCRTLGRAGEKQQPNENRANLGLPMPAGHLSRGTIRSTGSRPPEKDEAIGVSYALVNGNYSCDIGCLVN